ncbi:hypothetical protein Tco_0965509 [Tanacetum coccineum]
MSSECNNIKLAIRNAKSEVVCAMCKKCLITATHDVCVLNYVNDMNSRALNKKTHVSNVKNQKKHPKKDLLHLRLVHLDLALGDNACTSNPQEPISKRFPNSTFSMTGESNASALDDPTLQAGNPIKEILIKFNLPNHRLRDVAVYYHFAISTFPVKIVIRSSAFILEYLLQLPIRYVCYPDILLPK